MCFYFLLIKTFTLNHQGGLIYFAKSKTMLKDSPLLTFKHKTIFKQKYCASLYETYEMSLPDSPQKQSK